jgi:peptidoglycan/xylan/chitin deacetylase (PgdA/CDA1 family)
MEMKDYGIDFGSHTQNHVILTNEYKEIILEELKKSKEEIEIKTGLKVVTFAYPNGNYNNEVMTHVKDLGYECACTTEPGWVNRKTNIFKLNRVEISENPIYDNGSTCITQSYLDFLLYLHHFRR